jgi:hypothetical protein
MDLLDHAPDASTVGYAAIGNAVVGLVLLRRKIPVRFMWSGTPFYLYGACTRMTPRSRTLIAFALSTNISLLLAVPACIWFSIANS